MGIRDVYILGWVVPCEGLGTSDRHWDFRPRGVGACGRAFWLMWLIRQG